MKRRVCLGCGHRFLGEDTTKPEGCPECGDIEIAKDATETVRVPADPTPSENIRVANRVRQLSEDARIGRLDGATLARLQELLTEVGR